MTSCVSGWKGPALTKTNKQLVIFIEITSRFLSVLLLQGES